MPKSLLVAGCVVVLALTPAVAQEPTQAQRDAVRASCRSDFMANCASVQPGGKEALECLLRNESKLSAPCRSAVSAIAAPATSPAASPPAAVAPPQPAEAAPSGQSAMPAETAPPSTKRSHAPPATPNQKTPAAMRPASPPPSATTATPAVAPLGPIRPMLPRRALMVLAQCRPDQERLCAGVPAGGGKIFACLAANAQQLSPVCYDALARVSE